MSKMIRTAGEQLERSLEPVLTEHEQRHLSFEIGSVLVAMALYITGKIYLAFFPGQDTVVSIIYLIGALIASYHVFEHALEGFFAKVAHGFTEQLVSLAIIAAIAKGDYETAILVPVLLAIAHFLEERSIMGARAAIEGLKTLQAKEAFLLTADGEKQVPAGELQVGDRIVIRPGDMIPVDGEVLTGRSSVDQSSMTGETVPQDVVVGDQVYAGTVNIQGRMEVKVLKRVDETSLSKIVNLLRDAENSKTPVMRTVEKYVSYYQPAVLLIAACVLFLTKDVNRVIAIMVVSCPCAQILAGSSAMVSSLAVSARNGVLVKNSSFLEVLGNIKTVIFDKTGTLTEGNLRVMEMDPVEGVEPGLVLAVAAQAAQGSKHPVSRAIYRAARDVMIDEAAAVSELAGMGVRAETKQGEVLLGRRELLTSEGIQLPEEALHYGPVVWVALAGKPLGRILLADSLRADAAETISEIRELGIERAVMLTGDRREVAEAIGEKLSLDQIHAEALPSDKYQVVEDEKLAGAQVMVVGDGVNDALALASADVGIAMGAMGSDIAVQSSDVALMGNDLKRIPFIMALSRKTKIIIHQNLIIAGISGLTMVLLAATGIISPLLGAMLHNVGGFLVLFNSARLLKFDQKTD